MILEQAITHFSHTVIIGVEKDFLEMVGMPDSSNSFFFKFSVQLLFSPAFYLFFFFTSPKWNNIRL